MQPVLMNCARRFKPQLLEAQGSLIIVSSVAGFGANVGNPAYAASKAGADRCRCCGP
jgi:3-oxoacyl-[acyl-carrier protein] reductase